MMIRVDVYDDASNTITSTLHACMQTATKDSSGNGNSNDEDECWFTVGRKQGDILFPSDRTVSRQHCRFVRRNDTPAMALIVENFSKAGTFVAVEDQKTDDNNNHDDQDDSETDHDDNDEETDEEGISQFSKTQQKKSKTSPVEDVPPLSAVTKAIWGTKPVKLHKLDAGDSFLLDFTIPNTITKNDKAIVVVQVGRLGSTFVLTRIPLNIAFSRTNPAIHKLKAQMHLIGATQVPNDLPDETTTHLVTSERFAGAKQIIAWCYQIPIVSQEFLQSLLDRKHPNEPFPESSDYPAPIKRTKKEELFWNQRPNPTLLAHMTLISVESNDMERLAISAGAQRLAVYDYDDEDTALAKVQERINVQSIRRCCFLLESKKSKWIKRLTDMGIPVVKQRELASAITAQQSTLKDQHGNHIGDAEEVTPKTSLVEEEEMPQQRSNDVADSSSDAIQLEETQEVQTRKQPKRGRQAQSQVINEVVQMDINTKERAKTIPFHQTSDTSSTPQFSSETVGRKSAEAFEKQESSQQPLELSKKNRDASSDKSKTAIKKKIERLGGADRNGWFSIAPKDSRQRMEIRKRASDQVALKEGGVSLLPAAETETLVVPLLPNADNKWSVPSHSAVPSSRRGPNFKKFRKNLIYNSGAESRIALRAVLPKESEQKRFMEEQRQELEEQQRIVDELFQEAGSMGMKKRRRAL